MPTIALDDFRAAFSRFDRTLQRIGSSVGIVRGIAATGVRHPVAALRLARDIAAAAGSELFDRDFYAW